MASEGIVAVGLLTQRDVTLLGPTFERLWPVEEAPCFSEMLRAIDEADRELSNAEEPTGARLTGGNRRPAAKSEQSRG